MGQGIEEVGTRSEEFSKVGAEAEVDAVGVRSEIGMVWDWREPTGPEPHSVGPGGEVGMRSDAWWLLGGPGSARQAGLRTGVSPR